jgi:hypothetical protein
MARDPVDSDGVALAEEVCGGGVYAACQFLAGSCCEVGRSQYGGLVVREYVYFTALQSVEADVFSACCQAFVNGSEFSIEDFRISSYGYYCSYFPW